MFPYSRVEGLLKMLDRLRNRAILLVIDNSMVESLVRWRLLTPNGLTMFRLVITVILSTHFVTGYWLTRSLAFLEWSKWFVFTLFLVGAISDAFDGPLSRRFAGLLPPDDLRFGINFDRHIDKVFTGVLLLIYWPAYDVPTRWVVGVIVAGDLLATILAVISNKLGKPVPSNELGKAKMTMQCVGVGGVILRLPALFAQYVLVAALTLGVASLVINISRFRRGTVAN